MENHRYDPTSGVTLALSGGAARGAFHLGAIEALREYAIPVKAISGSSIGAIVGAGIAAGRSPRELLEIFQSRSFRKIFRLNLFGEGLLKIDRNAAILREIAPIPRLEDHPIPLYVTAVESGEGNLRRFNRGDTVSILLASAAIYPLFEPVIYRGEKLLDGGIYDNLPVEPLLPYPYPLLGINLHPNIPVDPKGLKRILTRSLFLSWHASIRDQIGRCDLYLAPPELNGLSFLGLRDLARAFDLGRESMASLLERPAPLPMLAS